MSNGHIHPKVSHHGEVQPATRNSGSDSHVQPKKMPHAFGTTNSTNLMEPVNPLEASMDQGKEEDTFLLEDDPNDSSYGDIEFDMDLTALEETMRGYD